MDQSLATPARDGIPLNGAVNDFRAGQKLVARYRLERVLGQGGMGVVWLARDEELDRDVALKFLPEQVVNDRGSLSELKKETRRTLELTHPNIVRTYDFVQDNRVAGISMEFVDSDTLRNLRLEQPDGVFQCAQIAEWTRQLCVALHYAHTQAAIVHRDLKPANLMVNRKGQLKITDFGISRSLVESVTQMTMNGGVSGTLVYMSPQQLTGELASPLDDVYAVGATIYELLTTRPPFYAGDITGQIQRKVPTSMAERRALLKIPEGEIPAKWEAVVAACLAKEPVERPQSALEIALRLGLTEGSATSVPTAAGSLAMARTSGPPSQPVGPATGGHPVISGFTTHYPPPTVAVPASRMPGQSTPLKRIGMTLVAALLLLVGASTVLLFRREKPTPPPAATPPPAKTGGSYGTLLVKTEPAGARVRVGNLPAGPSPYALDKLSPGPQTVQVSADGYEPQTIQVMIEADIFAKPPLIKLARSQGTLRVTSEPDTLPFEMKNRANPLAVTPGVTSSSPIELPSGEYEITVSRDGWPAQTRSVTVRGHEQEAANFQFLTGGLMVTSEPANATIMAGDVDLGETPKEISSLQPGPVSFTLKLKGYDPASVTGTVVAAQVNDLPVTLTKTAPGEKPTEPRPKPRPNDRDDDRDRDRGDRKPGLGHKIKEGFKSLNPFGKKTPTPAPKPKK